MATSRATLEARGVYRDQMTNAMRKSLDDISQRFDKFRGRMERALTIAKAWATVKIGGKLVDFVEKFASETGNQRFLKSQAALQFTFSKLGDQLASSVIPHFEKMFDGFRALAEDWGPALVRVFSQAFGRAVDWINKIVSGLGMIRNAMFEFAEWGHIKGLQGMKKQHLQQMQDEHFAYLFAKERRLEGKEIIEPERTSGLREQAWWLAQRDWIKGRINADIPMEAPEDTIKKKGDKLKRTFDMFEALTERWTITTEKIHEGLFRVTVVFEDQLVTALTNVITKTKDAKEAFAEFADAVYKQVVRLLVETTVQGFLGGVSKFFFPSPGGGGVQGFGGGGGGGIVMNIQNLNAIEPQQFADAAVKADHATGYHAALMLRASQRRADVRARFNLRRRR